MNAIPKYLLPDTTQVVDEHAWVGGVDLVEIATEFGTPTFVYDETHLRNKCREAVTAFPDGVAYASKAFLSIDMAKIVHECGMRIDVASGGEMHVALAAGTKPENIVLHGNNKSEAELRMAIEAGVGLIVIDSFDEIVRLERLHDSLKPARQIPCLIRVTPGIEAHTHEFIMTGQDDSKFGFGLNNGQADIAAEMVQKSDAIDWIGVHSHIGSLIFETLGFEREVEILAPFISKYELRELCVGGGLGTPYVTGEIAPTISDWAAAIHSAMATAGIPDHVAITSEPGRSIVGGAGITLYEVGTVKEVVGIRTYLSVDGGMSDNPRPILYDSGYEAFLPRRVNAERRRIVTIVGKHCESGDVLIRDAYVPADVQVGDILATPVTGAYGYTMASNYNRVTRPAVVMVANGKARVSLRRETFDDLLRLEAGVKTSG